MHRACIHVIQNKGSAGVDGMGASELKQYVQEHGTAIATRIINGKYLPQAIRGVHIPKSNGKKRLLGIPKVTDRWLQQSEAQAIAPRFEKEFMEHCYGFRPKKNAHDCILQSQKYVHEESPVVGCYHRTTFFLFFLRSVLCP